MCNMAPEPISGRTSQIPSPNQLMCLYMHPSIADRSRLCINVTAAPNTHGALEGLLDTLISMQSLYQRAVGD
jgi:hypothetical protein